MRFKTTNFTILSIIFAICLSASAIVSAAESYKIDTVHSFVIFRIKHLGVSYSYGRFNDLSGTFIMDEKEISKSTVDVTIKVDSIDTHHAKRDGHLKGPDFFNAKAFPVINFKGKKFKKVGSEKVQVTGDLLLHGVKKSITVEMTHIGSGKDPWGGYRSGFEGVFKIKRSDFGMNYMPEGIGDEVTITLGIEGIRQ